MKRNKHHKVKKEVPETSTSHKREQEEHDLAYYIHDRVELMHQVFSVIKYRELKLMAPACVRNISIDDLQELCTEELLGISSKRLCAILDGAEPPSDTESSSQSATEPLETISLDSISSDEEILSQEDKSKKKKHKHRCREKSKHKKTKTNDDEQEVEKSKASRAGLTVLELLELQARARAIRAQLQQEQIKPVSETAVDSTQSTHSHSSEDEVEIKEEPAEVVEISSDEEKPKIEELDAGKPQPKSPETSKTVTKRVNDLVITVPQQKTQKIKLKRPKSVPHDTTPKDTVQTIVNTDKPTEKVTKDTSKNKKKDKPKETAKDKGKTKKKKKKRLSNASDNDEITLQLSDSEKMDLLEDLDSKNFDNVSSEFSSGSDSDENADKKVVKPTDGTKDTAKQRLSSRESRKSKEEREKSELKQDVDNNVAEEKIEIAEVDSLDAKETEVENENADSNIEIANSVSTSHTDTEMVSSETKSVENIENVDTEARSVEVLSENSETKTEDKNQIESPTEDKSETNPEATKQLSEGELSDRESSEVEAVELKPEVVCISDEEDGKPKKKKKKKDKKSKKEKKSKKKDFRDSEDHNFHNKAKSNIHIKDSDTAKEVDGSTETIGDKQDIAEDKHSTVEIDLTTPDKSQDSTKEALKTLKENSDAETQDLEDESPNEIVEISDEVYELSGDSSNEDDTDIQVLSKEPTTSEIEALSAKIDEIERVEVITEEEIREYEAKKAENEEEITMSWKDRYLDSKKVKKVLNTSNILNALRKKNRQLKKRLEESKIELQENLDIVQEEIKDAEVPEGSIEQYNTLEGSTKFVDPIKEVPPNDTLKKDAKQLLKMYKKLLKYNDMNRKKDPSKKKKKKKSKKEKVEDKDTKEG